MNSPEQLAREDIDRLLIPAGWHVCDADKASIHTVRGVAIREFPFGGHGFIAIQSAWDTTATQNPERSFCR